MNLGERIRGWCTRRSVWLPAGTAAGLLLLLLAVSEQRHWQHIAAALERENLNLQLGQLTQQLMAVASQLTDRARELAQSDSVANLVPDNAPANDHAALAAQIGTAADSLLIVSASHAVRFSAKLADGRWAECPPDPELL